MKEAGQLGVASLERKSPYDSHNESHRPRDPSCSYEYSLQVVVVESSCAIIVLRIRDRGNGGLVGDLLVARGGRFEIEAGMYVAMGVVACSCVLSARVELASLVAVRSRDLPRCRPGLVTIGDWSGGRQLILYQLCKLDLQIHERRRVATVDMTSPGLNVKERTSPS